MTTRAAPFSGRRRSRTRSRCWRRAPTVPVRRTPPSSPPQRRRPWIGAAPPTAWPSYRCIARGRSGQSRRWPGRWLLRPPLNDACTTTTGRPTLGQARAPTRVVGEQHEGRSPAGRREQGHEWAEGSEGGCRTAVTSWLQLVTTKEKMMKTRKRDPASPVRKSTRRSASSAMTGRSRNHSQSVVAAR